MTGEAPMVQEALPIYLAQPPETERVPRGYRQSEVGVIPEDWEVRTFGEVFDFLATASNSRAELNVSGTVLYVHYGDIHKRWNHLLDFSKEALPRIELSKVKNADFLRNGDLILADASEDPEGVGKSVEVKNVNSTDAVGGLHTFVLRSRPRFFVAGYKGYIQSNETVKQSLDRIATGLKVFGISKNALKGVSLPIPPLSEQRAIAAALSDVDALIFGLDKLIAKKRAVKTAAMQQLLIGKQRLPGFSGEWEVKRLGDFAEMHSGGTPPSSVPDYYNGTIPWVSITDMTKRGKYIVSTDRNLTEKGLANSAARMFPKGTVLYAMYASLGECSIADVDLCSSQAILGIRPNRLLNNLYFYFVLVSKKETVKTLGQQGTQANPNAGIVKDFSVPIPSLQEQTAIATVLSDMDAEITALEARRDKTRQLKRGMMQELLTGRMRLLSGGDSE